ncbi:riboflavin synthase [uncultured Brevibacterium sp.]|uniref:riboflavin synthase n=1 Tax=uncultured Brevibacterium sp. TaxID=189678 RepID=UPI0025E1C265|nr:riboflavin synthase [uncultured Brevibacterium sp.]
MFTGIIESLGTVTAVDVRPDGGFARITIAAGEIVADLPRGGSLAVNGVCLTAVPGAGADHDTHEPHDSRPTGPDPSGVFSAEVIGETLARTNLGSLRAGDRVDLERCMPAGGRFDGHVVQGHVDGVGTISRFDDEGGWVRMRVDLPAELAPYTAEKGSIALDGASLTLTAVSAPGASPAWVEVGLIPATLEHTVFGSAAVGRTVNVEVDVLAKYAARLLSFTTGGHTTPDLAPIGDPS